MLSNLSIQWSVPTTYDICNMYILCTFYIFIFIQTQTYLCILYSRYLCLYVIISLSICIYRTELWSSVALKVSNLFSAVRILCVLISSAVVTTTNSTTTFICSEDAPRKNVQFTFIPNCKYGNSAWILQNCYVDVVYVSILKLRWCR